MNLNLPSQPLTEQEDILVVDDKPENLRLLSSMLKDQGYKVRKAMDGEMAIEAVKMALPDLILLDITMPRMNGYQVCQHLKADPQTAEIPVIFISALDEIFDKVKAFAVGGIDYITKPLNEEEVFLRVESQLKIRRLQKELQSKNTQIKQSEERFSTAFNANPNPITITSLADGKHLLVNQSFLDITGYSLPEVENRTALDLNLWVSSEARQFLFQKIQDKGQVRDYEFEFRTQSGEIRTALLSTAMIELNGEECLLSISNDITERKHAEERFTKAFNANPNPITITSLADGKHLLVNQSFLKITGYSAEDVLGHTAIELNLWVDIAERHSLFQTLQENRSIQNYKIQFRTQSGEIRIALLSAEIITLNGQDCLLSISNDITEQERSDRKYHNIFHNSQVAIFRTRIKDGLFIEANQRLIKMIGYDSIEEVVFKKYSRDFYVNREDRKKMLKQLQSQGEVQNFETQFRRQDGSVFWGLFSARINPSENCLDGVINDISHFKSLF